MTVLWEATGILSWSRRERVGDRYGAVALCDAVETDFRPLTGVPVGATATLVATVLETRQSQHIGDLFRGFSPPRGGTPAGTRVVLGTGVVFMEDGDEVGLRPVGDDRQHDWLDPIALYRVHDQVVRLTLELRDFTDMEEVDLVPSDRPGHTPVGEWRPEDTEKVEAAYGKTMAELAAEAERGFDPDRLHPRRTSPEG